MKKRLVFANAIIILLMLHAGTAIAQRASEIDSLIASYIEKQHKYISFSGTILVAKGEEILSLRSIGAASRELNVPIYKDSKFKIASVTKAFTGMLVALAIHEGRLRFDDKLSSYFTEGINEKWHNITIRQLLSHTSGIPHWSGINDYWPVKSKLSLNKEQVLKEIFKMRLLFEPGTKVEYSSPAYYLLATILEKQYHKSYDALLQEQILGPLHMQQTGVYDQTAIISKMVSGYNLVGDTGLIVAPYRDVSAMGGGGNMYATATDLLHWCRSFLSGKWDSSIVQTTFSPSTAQPISHKGGSLYGMGWYLREKTDQQPKAYHIGGGTFGFSSKIAIYPEENFCIIILANVSFLPLDDVLWKDIEAMAFGKPFKMPMQSAVQVNLPVGELEKFTGSYASTNGMELNIFVQEKSLYVKLGRNPPLAIYAKSPYEFFARKIDIQFVFTFSKEGKVTALKSNGRGRTDHFTKR